MPRIMTAVYPTEIVVETKITYILSEYVMPRRVYTDGRDWPQEIEPAFAGYSIGKWIDEDGDGRHRQGELFSQRRRLPDAVEERPAPAGSALFSGAIAQMIV